MINLVMTETVFRSRRVQFVRWAGSQSAIGDSITWTVPAIAGRQLEKVGLLFKGAVSSPVGAAVLNTRAYLIPGSTYYTDGALHYPARTSAIGTDSLNVAAIAAMYPSLASAGGAIVWERYDGGTAGAEFAHPRFDRLEVIWQWTSWTSGTMSFTEMGFWMQFAEA
jgi:hypothetical protein